MRKKTSEKKNQQLRIVLVGTYKGDQLTRWPGWYCWPLGKDDFNAEAQRRGEKNSHGDTEAQGGDKKNLCGSASLREFSHARYP